MSKYIWIKCTLVGYDIVVDSYNNKETIFVKTIDEVIKVIDSLKDGNKLNIVCINEAVADRLLLSGAVKTGAFYYEVA